MKPGRILLFSVAHFVVAMLVSVAAFGTDLDQLSSRSVVSSAAAHVHRLLWWPHDAVLRSLPPGFISRHPVVTPIAIVFNSLVCGVMLAAVARMMVIVSRTRPNGSG